MDKKTLELLAVEGKQAEEAEERQAAFKDEATKIMLEQQRYDIEKLKEEIKDIQQDRLQRKDFANKIFDFMCWYLFGVFVIILMNGISTMSFHINDEIILTLLKTTAIEVIGTFAIVASYLFYRKK